VTARLSLAQSLFGSLVDHSRDFFWPKRRTNLPHRFAFIKQHGFSFEQAAAARQAAGSDHNRREAPLFAKSIERKALAHSAPSPA
jgi:hypothetical protein